MAAFFVVNKDCRAPQVPLAKMEREEGSFKTPVSAAIPLPRRGCEAGMGIFIELLSPVLSHPALRAPLRRRGMPLIPKNPHLFQLP
jgi:hypothetical protein